MTDARDRSIEPELPGPRTPALLVIDLATAVAGACVDGCLTIVRNASRARVLRSSAAWRPPLVPLSWQPASLVTGIARQRAGLRDQARRVVGRLLDMWTPVIVEAVVTRLDLTDIVTRNVDIDEVVRSVDLDAVIARIDADAIVRRIDLDAAVASLDLNAAAKELDIDAIASRLDIEALLAQIDLDRLVARLDLNAAATALDIDAVAGRLDLDALISRIDLVGLVEGVIAAIDLPAIIRESSGSVASQTVQSARMTGISGDEAVSRALDRYLFRRRHETRSAEGPR